jgi:hypothetical protein
MWRLTKFAVASLTVPKLRVPAGESGGSEVVLESAG